jgi:hypothetical protein
MPTPTYIVKRIGDQYVPVLQDPSPACCNPALMIWGGLLAAYGLRRRGWLGAAGFLGGVSLVSYGVLVGYNPLRIIPAWFGRHAPNGNPHLSPSYQNDVAGRAAQLPADDVDEASMESFPASDAPSR